ncbi:MAG: dGTP triphosphohydrolase [bacterium]
MKNKRDYRLRTRQELEQLELKTLATYAKPSQDAFLTRRFEESQHAYRTAFQRDRDRIIHSRAFRRLKHKRQVFLTTEGDHYRTRITHTLEVSQLSRTMAKTLGLNEDLVEAIALGHDLGHTPFGHLGEVVLNEIMSGGESFAGMTGSDDLGGFKHNYQSVRVVDRLESKYRFDGLNLTSVVREGILKHTRLKRGQFNYPDFFFDGLHFELDSATTLEGQVVAICDEIAQRTHDLEDGIRADLVEIKRVRELALVQQVEEKLGISRLAIDNERLYRGLLIRGLINFLVDDVIHTTLKNIAKYEQKKGRITDFDAVIVDFSPEMDPLQKQLNKFIYQEIIDFSRAHWSDELGKKLLYRLFEAYYQDSTLLPEDIYKRDLKSPNSVAAEHEKRPKDSHYCRTICDYIAGMTDHYAIREAKRLAVLEKVELDDLHLESALGISPADYKTSAPSN